MRRKPAPVRHVGWHVATDDETNRWRVVRPDGLMLDASFDSLNAAHAALDEAATA